MTDLQQDLNFIRGVVESGRRAARVDAAPLLAWGLLTVAGIVGVYAVPALDTVWFWLIVIGLAWAYTAARAWSPSAHHEVSLLAHRALHRLWFAVLTGMTLVGFVGYFSGVVPAPAIVPVIATLFGVAYLASGALLDFRPAAAIGVAWWIVAIVLFIWQSSFALALFGLAVLLLVVLPAAWMRRSDWSAG
ncbi:hypothetical protein BH24PSE2_BH24PSE2_24390 [soil metagenome]